VKSNPIPYLLATTLLELAALPFHLVSFFVRRKRIRAHVRSLLEHQWDNRSTP